MFLRTSGALFVSALTTLTGHAQTADFQNPSQVSSSPEFLLSEWKADHGDSWHLRTAQNTGTLEMLFGGNALPPFEPNTNKAEDWFALGRYWIQETIQMHLVDGAELVDARFRYLPLGQGNTNDKITVRFEQVIGGVPVESGTINVLFDTNGRLLSIHNLAAASVESPDGKAVIDAGFANLIAARAFKNEFGSEPTTQGAERLVHAFIDDGETRRWALAWQVEASLEVEGEQPIGRLYTVDAKGRGVLKSINTVHNFDVFGTISSNATPGTTADRNNNSPVPIAMPRVRITSSAGTVETDRDGNFNITGVNTPIDLTVTYFGQFTNVNNDQGNDYSITFPNVQPNQQNDLLMNPNPTEFVTSQANSQLHINVLRDWIRDRFPTDNTADFRAASNNNLAQSCNAFFNGNSVNFYNAQGSCNNTAFSTVVAHEMGHWLNVRYGTNNGSDGMGEGNADVFAMYLYDTPTVGGFFFTNGGNIRTGNNTRQFCGDANPGCYGAVHTDGQVWMGAAWKIRTQLNNSLGNAMGDMVADSLFLGWMNSYNQQGIRSVIETQWLTLDDDDGNINNGTPNYQAIDAGFRAQGFPGFDLPFLTVANVTEVMDSPLGAPTYSIDATVTANLGTNIATVEVFAREGSNPFVSNNMTNVGGDVFNGTINGGDAPRLIQYYVRATDNQGNFEEFPDGGAANALTFALGDFTTVFSTDFENGALGFTSGAPGDDATTGIWELGDPIGTAAQPENDHSNPGSNCWFTGQGSNGGSLGENDVDNGRTSLVSPTFDAAGSPAVLLSYWRWYSNTEGGAPNADIFRVQVSNNDGGSWTNVETVGPDGNLTDGGWFQSEVSLAGVTPTATMRVRFIAEDAGTGSIVEAAIDDIEIAVLGDGTVPPVNYCDVNANSSGVPAIISSFGSQSISTNDMVLLAVNMPSNSFGIFFFGDSQLQQPIANSNGILCVGGSLLRLPPVQTNVFGEVTYPLDFTSTTTNEGTIMSGDTFNFQFWFRDAVGGMTTSNTSNGLRVLFVD